jgi:hypothetical protein
LSSFFCSTAVFAADNSCEKIVNDFPGTYKLVKRTMPDGTVLKGSEAQGTLVYTKEGRNAVTISIHNPQNDTYDMIAFQSHYSISPTVFTNKIITMAGQYGKSNSPVKYMFDQSKLSSPVTCKNGTLDIQHPAEYPLADLKITDSRLTAYHNNSDEPKGAIDEWIRIN